MGGAILDGPTDDDPGNVNGRFKWTTRLRDDLMQCYESSEPARRGYMTRLHELWCQKHPEHRSFSKQHLRDHVSFLRRTGYVRPVPAEPAAAASPPRHVAEDRTLQDIEADTNSRDINIHRKISLRAQDLARMDARVNEELPEDASILQINAAVYHAATQLMPPHTGKPQALHKTLLRIQKIKGKLQLARQHASRIQCVVDYLTSGRQFTGKVRKIVFGLKRQHHTINKTVLLTIKQHCLERIRALGVTKGKLKRRAKWIEQNFQFRNKPAGLFQGPQLAVEEPPTVERVENFWKEIYETKHPFNDSTPGLAHFKNYINRFARPNEVCPQISSEEVRNALDGSKNFAAPGPDRINNFWWKKFPSTHRRLANVFNSWLNGVQPIPDWFVEGRTVLIPKKGDLSNPKNYRPITCLNTCYKIFTRILYVRILSVVDPIFQKVNEQRGAKRGVAGCKENLLIDRCITQDAVQYKRNLCMAWIDYSKAFDTTSHELIIHMLKCLSVPAPIVRCIENLLPLWRTRFTITSGERKVSTEPITYKRGVFQGDSLSPLLFCISLLPLSVYLRQTRGYNCGPPSNRRHKVTHLFYMDDLKIYAASQADLDQSIRIVHEYSRDIGMAFGLDKCAVLHLKRGRSEEIFEEMPLADGSAFRHLDVGETYTYLGIHQRHLHDEARVKSALRDKYKRLLRQIWSSELSGKNKVSATNMLAVPILLYSFGAVRWTVDEIGQLDRDSRKMLNMQRSLHPRSSVPRIYLPRHQGGRGLLSLECMHNRIVLGMACTVIKSSDPLLRFVNDHEKAGVGAFLFKAAERAADELGLQFTPRRRDRAANIQLAELEPNRRRALIKGAENSTLLRRHVDKPMHGMFFRHVEEHGLSKKLTYAFLKSAGLRSETEGFIIACQDGVFNTLVYRSQIMGEEVPSVNCRACRTAPESLMHLLSACPKYAVSAYIHRHNAALRVLYYHLRHSYKIDETPLLPYAPGDIESVVENDRSRVYWNFAFSTTQQIQANKPDIVLLDKEAKSMYVIEFSAPAETNITVKEEHKRTKYQDLLFELKRLYPENNIQLVVLIIGVLGGMKDTLLSELRKIPACQASAETLAASMQKAVILGSLRLLRAHES
jgi:hypothetical protein